MWLCLFFLTEPVSSWPYICRSPVEIVLWKQPLHLSPFIHSSVSEGNIIIRGAVKFCILLRRSFRPTCSFQPPQPSCSHALIFIFISVMCFACSSSKVGLSLISQSTPSSLWKLFGRLLMINYYCVPERLAKTHLCHSVNVEWARSGLDDGFPKTELVNNLYEFDYIWSLKLS